VWLVDAVTGGGEPGSIARLAHEDVLAVPSGTPPLTPQPARGLR
jgi:hypothetical protein